MLEPAHGTQETDGRQQAGTPRFEDRSECDGEGEDEEEDGDENEGEGHEEEKDEDENKDEVEDMHQ